MTKTGSVEMEQTKSQIRKGVLELCILSVISQGEVYTLDILEKLKQADLIVVEGTLYPLLSRLKNEELLSYSWAESKGGPPRKYYNLTKKGEVVLSQLNDYWDEINNSVNKLRSISKNVKSSDKQKTIKVRK